MQVEGRRGMDREARRIIRKGGPEALELWEELEKQIELAMWRLFYINQLTMEEIREVFRVPVG
jgi:hypothetical protein